MKEIKGTVFSTMSLEEINNELNSGSFDITIDSERMGTLCRKIIKPGREIIVMSFAKFRRANKKDLKRKKCNVIKIVGGKGIQSLDKMNTEFYFVK